MSSRCGLSIIWILAVTVKLGRFIAISKDSSHRSTTLKRSLYCWELVSTSTKPCLPKNSRALRSANATMDVYYFFRWLIISLPRPFCWQSDLIDRRNSSQIPVSHPSYLCSRHTEPPMTRPVPLSTSTKLVHLGSRILAWIWPRPILGSSCWIMLDKSMSLWSSSQFLMKLSEF